MSETLEWASHEIADGGVVERSFRLVSHAGTIPGVLWLPGLAGPSDELWLKLWQLYCMQLLAVEDPSWLNLVCRVAGCG